MTFIDSRVYPMFAFLFGYGMVQLFSSQVASGVPVKQARRLLRRRNSLVLAYAQEWAGQRGPAEVLLRRLVYRQRP